MSRIDSQSTTDEKDEDTEDYVDDPHNDDDPDHDDTRESRSGCKMSRAERLENWPHDRQPGWSQYSDSQASKNSQTSKVSCSLDVPLAQADPEQSESFDPVRDPILSAVVVPETPKSGIDTPGQKRAKSGQRMVTPTMNKKEAEEQIQRITEYLEQYKYTVFTHKTTIGHHERTMHLAFFMYEDSGREPNTPDDESQQPGAAH